MAAELRQEDFTPHVGKEFRFAGWHGTLRLARIEAGGIQGMAPMERTPFLLIFQGAKGSVLPEGMYAATTVDGVDFHFHIMPIHTAASDRQDYQVVFG